MCGTVMSYKRKEIEFPGISVLTCSFITWTYNFELDANQFMLHKHFSFFHEKELEC